MSIECAGDILAPITAPTKVNIVKARKLLANISASGANNYNDDYYAIGTIEMTEDIGSVSSLVSITTDAGPYHGLTTGYDNGAIRKIVARNIFANIATPRPTGAAPYGPGNRRGDIVELITNPNNLAGHGRLVGQIDTFSFGYSTGNQTPSMDIHGTLEAVVNLDGTFKQPVVAHGGVTGTAVISLLEKDLVADNLGIAVTGDMAGRIEIEGNKDAPITVTGDVTGTIDVGKSVRGVAASRPDYGGRIKIDGSVASSGAIGVGGTVINVPGRVEIEIDGDMAGRIDIGRSLDGQLKINTAAGLKGQVIINQNNGAGAAAGRWGDPNSSGSGDVTVGATVLTHDAEGRYAIPSSQLGGGAVGLAPFRLYEADCFPPHNSLSYTPAVLNSDFADITKVPVKIAQYGPVRVAPDMEPGSLIIEVQSEENPCAWVDMTAVFKWVKVFSVGSNWRTIGLRGTGGGVPCPGVYRVRAGSIVCDDVTDNPPLIWPTVSWGVSPSTCSAEGVYVFRIFPDCNGDHTNDLEQTGTYPDGDGDGVLDICEGGCHACDINHSGGVTVQDLFDFLTVYFASPACIAPVTGMCTDPLLPGCGGWDADVNDSCTVSVQDIFDFLACFFANQGACP